MQQKKSIRFVHNIVVSAVCCAFALPVFAVTIDNLLKKYAGEVTATGGSGKFTAEAGKKLYMTQHKDKHGEMVACATCHTDDPKAVGKSKVGKDIDPLAPAANKKRFTDEAKVEKWFKRNCKEVLQRECTAQEKGDFVAYMKSVK